MTTDNLFDPNTNQDTTKDYLQELVGEGKKFKSEQDLARGKFESDQYIKVLEGRLDELREDYTKVREDAVARAKLQDLIDQLENKELSENANTQANESRDKPNTFDPKHIKEVVAQQLEEFKSSEKRSENLKIVKDRLEREYGEKYQTVLQQHMETLGLDKSFVAELAGKQPQALFRMLGMDAQKQEGFQSPPSSALRNDNFAPKTQKRTWSYYQGLKSKDPKIYYDPKTAIQMQKDAIELGEAFKDGDFGIYGD